MRLSSLSVCIMIVFQLTLTDCSQKESVRVEELKFYSADELSEIINISQVSLDSTVYAEGTGSLKIIAEQPIVVKLYETGNLGIDNCRIIYQAKLKTRNLQGETYLEMWCHFPGKGDFFSRALQSKLSGDNNWSSQETPFMLQKGEKPDNVKLNLAVNGTGTVWIDDIRLMRAPLQ